MRKREIKDDGRLRVGKVKGRGRDNERTGKARGDTRDDDEGEEERNNYRMGV